MKVGVKELAEFVHRRGDIHSRQPSATLAQEGIARQKQWQQQRGDGYRREHRVAAPFGAAFEVQGRIDGWDAAAGVVEEIKTTRADARQLHAQAGDANLAQLRLYGGMLALADETLAALTLRLVYLHPRRPTETVFEEAWSSADLIAFFEATCGIYAAWLDAVAERLRARDRAFAAMSFPYGGFRGEQRRLAKHVYRAFRDREHCLVEAPTGSGKTIACLFPALKAMAAGEIQRLVFVTSRGTGQRAAEAALRDAAGDIGAATAVTITAKERICFRTGERCGSDCEYARGYYERLPAARRDLLAVGLATREQVERVAAEHRVCPFELSLDVAEWADVVVCDYNYVFDPVVRLRRLDNAVFRKVALVVDEAHQLGERVRDMLSAELPRPAVRAALSAAGLPSVAASRFRSLDRSLAALGRGSGDGEREIDPPAALCRAVGRLLETVPAEGIELEAFPAAAEAYWLALHFQRATERAREDGYHYLLGGQRREVRVRLICTNPSDHIRATMAPFHGSVRQSGTLSPARTFQRVHGFGDDAKALAFGGGGARLGVFVVPGVSTYYRDRTRTLPSLAELVHGVADASPGNCLVALPSFEYVRLLAVAYGAGDSRCQTARMDLAERDDFIRWMNEAPAGRVGFVVMGGVFAESVDFDGSAVGSIVVVGPGLAPRSLQRDLVAKDSVAAGIAEDGDEVAYRQPAMTRVVQAIGRIARGNQPGVAVLADPRFASAAYQRFFPSRWQPVRVGVEHVAETVARFWLEHRRAPTDSATTSDEGCVKVRR